MQSLVIAFRKHWLYLFLVFLSIGSLIMSITFTEQSRNISKINEELIESNTHLQKILTNEVAKKSIVLDNGYVYFTDLTEEMNVYMNQLCIMYEVDIYIVYAILKTENSTLKENAVNYNSNGTVDLGLFQMNDKYTWTEFVPNYWNKSREFEVFNWRDNMYVAIGHIADLNFYFGDIYKTFCAYNGGRSATKNNNLIQWTLDYATAAMRIYKQESEEEGV